MPRGGNHGGGRPKLPPELKAKTYSYCFSPIAKLIKNNLVLLLTKPIDSINNKESRNLE